MPALPDKPEEQLPIVEPNDPAVAVPSRPLPRIPGLPTGMTPTRRCPSCESGMKVPGILPNVVSDKLSLCQVKLQPSLGDLEDLRYRKVG